MKNTRLHVAVGVIVREDKVLIAKRLGDDEHGECYEFPGGKIEQGEQIGVALRRELYEELGIHVEHYVSLGQITFDYPHREVHLHLFRIESFNGEASGREGQIIEWAPLDQLHKYTFLEANAPIVRRSQLKPFVAITPVLDPAHVSFSTNRQQLIHAIAALDDDVLCYMRQPAFSVQDYRSFIRALDETQVNIARRLIVPYALQPVMHDEQLLVAGYHLPHMSNTSLAQLTLVRDHALQVVSAACHNTHQMMVAAKLGCDAALLSPVLATATHPEAIPMGWVAFAEECAKSILPVYGLGGLTPADRPAVIDQGGFGVAAIRAFFQDLI